MQVAFNHLDFLLHLNGTLAVRRPARMAVTVKRGSVWLTQDAHTEDHVLQAGQTIRIRDNEPVVLSALQASEVELREGHRYGQLDRMLRVLAAWALRAARPAIRRRVRQAREGRLPLF
jgi:hypothetical protein